MPLVNNLKKFIKNENFEEYRMYSHFHSMKHSSSYADFQEKWEDYVRCIQQLRPKIFSLRVTPINQMKINK